MEKTYTLYKPINGRISTYELVQDPEIIYTARREIRGHESDAKQSIKEGHVLAYTHSRREAERIRKMILNQYGILID